MKQFILKIWEWIKPKPIQPYTGSSEPFTGAYKDALVKLKGGDYNVKTELAIMNVAIVTRGDVRLWEEVYSSSKHLIDRELTQLIKGSNGD